ncbi:MULTISPECIES: sensor histidine kinase [Chryseobacterium]|uniref:histidine kinase n=1 Tax=Chryseobacterium rhizosphaerae TaxID=395937 RepID=A0ABX9IEY3_9FLAO|nr:MULTISPECIES: HAMP domain-containing sensor histidine kinase [Chryseobacterium]REC71323.1 sensor histidine kinase [Chryseobacterium rhizosphaerae]GEN69300.1 two-component sensor histidine kinase [Chryseobacterium rhizosphaerae]SMD01232.1 two-component system, OmpR family, phosphate regulon sensor histidine kinase PhoR [Chryseobacterium sp. YR221]
MMSKSKYLIPLFATLFLILLGIQVFFIYKTYQVKERDIYRSIQEGLSNYTDKLEDVSTKEMKDDSLQSIIIKYHDKEISKKEFLTHFLANRQPTREKLNRYISSRFKKEGYDISAKIQYYSIIHLPDSTKIIDQPIVIYETKNKVKNSKISTTSSWETSSTQRNDSNNKEIERKNTFLVKSKTEFEIANIKIIVFKELTLLIICCIILLASVLLLYIFTVKNLIRQQKQVEVLHTVVDNISHEFKTPIATLKIAAKTLKKDWNPETLPLIDRQIYRLETLMSQLHKDEIPDKVTAVKPEDWNFFIQDLAFTYSTADFTLENNISQELPFDKNLMETVIKNLCENSVKYGASNIKVNISSSQQHLEIEVSDNGFGMETKELKNIFEKFYRIQANNIHNNKGLGLGLYIVKRIVTEYHGKVQVSSQPKVGTTFKISIPYEN